MQILFAGVSDWANASNRIARGINTAAGRQIARVLTLSPKHPFRYEEDAFTTAEAFTQAKNLDWLISTGDGHYNELQKLLDFLPLPSKTNFATAHVGSAYRNHAADYNKADQEAGFKIRFIGGDLFRLAEGDPKAVPYFAPPHTVSDNVPLLLNKKVHVAHAPSNRGVKGTETILTELTGIEIDLLEKLSFQECTQRRSRCHIFVDQLNDLGGFGAAATEAMSNGCAVLGSTANISPEVDRFYPRPPIVEITRATIRAITEDLIADRIKLEKIRRASLSWSQKHARPEAIGRYWLKHLEAAM